MKWVLFSLCCLALPLRAADLSTVHAVYMLPMANGMDQFLANRLTNLHVFQVVTDPQRADAVLTDRIGHALESQLQDLYPPPEEKGKKEKKETKPAEKASSKDAQEAKDKEPESSSENAGAPPVFGDTVNTLPKVGSLSSFGRHKGTVFLVDVKSRQILWSTYQRPKDTTSRQLDKTALQIVNLLKQDIAGKSAAQ